MNQLTQHNIKIYNKAEETSYMGKKNHSTRGRIAIEMISEVLNRKNHQKLLSIACSVGIYEQKMIKELGLEVYGIDGAVDALKEAKKRGVITKIADVSKPLPFNNASFDFVFAGEIIEHLLDTKAFLLEIYRVLKPGGYLIITTPNLARIDDRIKFLFGKSPRHTTPIHPYLYLHIRPFTYNSLRNALELCGFTDLTLRTQIIALEFFGKKISIYSNLLTNLFPNFGATLIVRGKKSRQ